MGRNSVIALAALAIIGNTGCTSPESAAAWDNLRNLETSIRADGVVTETEATQYVEAFNTYVAAVQADAGQNWMERLTDIGVAIVATFFGVQYARNNTMLGTKHPGPQCHRIRSTKNAPTINP